MTSRPRWNRSIAAMIICVFCSSCAALIAVTALGKQVYDLSHRELDLGLLGLAEFAPSALLVLVTGSIADRYNRARVSSVSAAVQAVIGVGLALYAATDPTSTMPIFALVVGFGAGRAFLAPANRAMPADIVSAEHLPWLTARRSATWQFAVIAGPVIGGFLYVVHPAVPYVAMAGFLAVASVSMFFVETQSPRSHAPPDAFADIETAIDPTVAGPPAPPFRSGVAASGRLRDALEGLRFIRGSPVLLGAISLDLFAVLFGGAIALLPARRRLRFAPAWPPADDCAMRSKGYGSSGDRPCCSARSRSICSPSSSVARSRCCRPSPTTGWASVRSASGGSARPAGSARPSSRS